MPIVTISQVGDPDGGFATVALFFWVVIDYYHIS